ncbi:VWA domain-containing protein [Corynebacterium sp.]|uniref:vWA domain-containing protein n=1 Tax=Corynebacterium sp. TaxID=1720 RepID=UPI0026DC4D24|nr:VWA domain-containing protein [Corynebacterium sp.]MDO5077211.1 hypothetical protein [Corynebacterium sp.]
MLSPSGVLRLRSLLALSVAVGLVVGVSVSPPASAQEAQPATALVIDASAAMLVNNLGGPNPMDAEKQGVEGLLNQLPSEQLFALVAIGDGTGTAPEEREAGCKDARTIAPLSQDRGPAIDGLRGVQPRGYRPLGAGLLQAERELPAEGQRQIVLVSSGADGCAPPPACDIAKEIRERSGDVVINVVGFNVDEQARGELQCIAGAGGGSYADASDADSLKKQLVLKSTRVEQKYLTGGVQVKGTKEAKDAPVLELGGLKDGVPQPTHYQDVMPRNEALHYKVKVEPGQRFAIGFVTPPPAVAGNDVGIYMNQKVDIFDSTGRTCSEDQGISSIADGFSKPSAGYAVSKDVDDKDLFACKPGELDVVISRDGALGAESDLPVEFKLWRLPNVKHRQKLELSPGATLTSEASPNAASTSTSAPQPPPNLEIGNPAGPLPSALGLSDAPVVQPGVYDAILGSGDMLWFKVPVQEGQRLQIKLETPPIAPGTAEAPAEVPAEPAEPAAPAEPAEPAAPVAPVVAEPVAEDTVPIDGFLEWVFLNPVYAPVEAETFSDNKWQPTYALFTNTEQPKQALSVTQPLTWANADNGNYGKGFLSGEQYVAIRFNTFPVDLDEGYQPAPVQFKLAVETLDEAQQAPEFTYDSVTEDTPRAQGLGPNGGIVSVVVKVLLGVMALGLLVFLGLGVFVLVRRKR